MKLEVHDLVVGYGPVEAVRGVTLEVETGNCVAVVGSNGAGKSSLLAGIAGIVPDCGGRVELDGRAMTDAAAHERARAGMVLVPENRHLFPQLSIEETLRIAAAHARPGPWNLDTVFDLFPNLRDRRDLLAGNASGGEAQMLAIARALMLNPAILMLDEPSSGLAPTILSELLRSMRSLLTEGLGILLVEQNIRGAHYMADHALVMENGLITRSGPASILSDDEDMRRSYLGR